MTKLTICRGVSGSGKTTWAKQQNGVVVERDATRKMLFGTDGPDYYSVAKEVLRHREEVVTTVNAAQIESLLKEGIDVYNSDTNIEWKYVKALAKIAHHVGAEVEVKVFDVPLQRAINNNTWRAANGARDVPREVITKQHQRFQGNKNKELDAPFIPQPYNGTPGKPKAFLFDLDGTTYHMGNKRGPYDHNVDVDDPDPTVIHIIQTMALELIPIAMSGRVAKTRETTIKCLERDGVPFEHLFMRADGDFRSDDIVKVELFDSHIRNNFDVQFVLDDRNQVVDAWRRMDLKCLQVAEGNF